MGALAGAKGRLSVQKRELALQELKKEVYCGMINLAAEKPEGTVREIEQ